MSDEKIDSARPGPWPEALDAMNAAPEHHKILFENEQVRVLDTCINPGGQTPVHAHPWPSVLYILSWSDMIRCDAEGNVLLDTRKTDSRPEDGTAMWSPPLGPHSAKNVGGQELRAIAVELKGTVTANLRA